MRALALARGWPRGGRAWAGSSLWPGVERIPAPQSLDRHLAIGVSHRRAAAGAAHARWVVSTGRHVEDVHRTGSGTVVVKHLRDGHQKERQPFVSRDSDWNADESPGRKSSGGEKSAGHVAPDAVYFRSLSEFVRTKHHIEKGNRRQAFFVNGLNLQYRLGGGTFGQVYLAEELATGIPKAIKEVDVKKMVPNGGAEELSWLTSEERQRADEDSEWIMDHIRKLADGVVKQHMLDAYQKLQGRLQKEKDPQKRNFRRPVAEHEILKRLSVHPFVSNLETTFVDDRKLYLVFKFYNCGTLKEFMNEQAGGRFNEPAAKFLAAEIALGLKFLHENNVAHRDIKPDNILLGGDGHIAISDFGLATRLRGGLKTLCGTAEYIAPEVLSSKTWRSSYLDWWAFGITLYEMLVGRTPFEADSAQAVFLNTLTAPLQFPPHVSPQAKDLISKLLSRDYSKRILPKDVLSHPFFVGTNTEMMYRKLVDPPLLPRPRETKMKHRATLAMRRRPRIDFSLDSTLEV